MYATAHTEPNFGDQSHAFGVIMFPGRRSFLLVLLMVGLIGTATLAFLLRTGPPSRSCSALDAERRSEMATRRVGVQQIAFSLLTPFVLTAGADVAAAVVRPLSCVSYYSRISS
ncbi:hypothetical protein Naga_100082g13 [Nannochloropsis gaditana]|uniref:Uncharacterized protein n=1 Tax=Nannochloropsis gaditana TaxID=72520 RepID=W7TTP1_9STRA|nr:hypothetical protein Naga_100082g13 [Nannochloropsis gaditana]